MIQEVLDKGNEYIAQYMGWQYGQIRGWLSGPIGEVWYLKEDGDIVSYCRPEGLPFDRDIRKLWEVVEKITKHEYQDKEAIELKQPPDTAYIRYMGYGFDEEGKGIYMVRFNRCSLSTDPESLLKALWYACAEFAYFEITKNNPLGGEIKPNN